MNTGLDLEKEKLDQNGDEWQFGASSKPALFVIPSQELRILSLPNGEIQRGKEDTMDCATRGPINKLEALFTYGVRNKKFSQKNIDWLVQKGYVTDDLRVTFSDAFIAIKSGTSRNGNSMKAPIHAIHEFGLIPKHMLPLEKWMTWDDYHNKGRITVEMEDLARAFSKRFDIEYEQVSKSQIKNLNRDEMLVVAGYAWVKPISGIYPRTEDKPNHVFVSIKPEFYIFDNYLDTDNDFIKRLAPDYNFYEYAYRIYIAGENDTVVDGWWSVQVLSDLISKIKEVLSALTETTEKKT